MIQETVSRLNGFTDPEQVMVVTNDDYVPIVKQQLPSTKQNFIIGEPVAKNTAPCVASAAALLHKKDSESVMVVLPADHQIGRPREFLNILNSAVETAKTENSLVTIGIKPSRPETGYGYIRFRESSKTTKANNSVFEVHNFTEKPERKRAEEFLASGDYLWNSGMFIWKTDVILNAFKQHLPDVYKEAQKLIDSDADEDDINTFYNACPSVSIDYGIMEKAEMVHVVPGDFDWNDVGSWTAVHELSEKDENGNAAGKSPGSFYDASSNLIHSDSGKLVSLVGVDNIAVVETDKAILVVNLDQAQDVKEIVKELKKDPGKIQFL